MTGQSCGVHCTGGLSVAATPARMEYLRNEAAKHRVMGIESKLICSEEILELCPIINTNGLLGGLYDENEGHVDCSGVVHAYAKAAKLLGASWHEGVKVTGLLQRAGPGDLNWEVQTEQGTILSEHVVNAAGLWAREVGAMAGVHVPILPMQHHYLITEAIPELTGVSRELPMVLDLDGNTYMRQERKGCLLGVYEASTTEPWAADGTPWDYGENQLLDPDLDRISEYLQNAFERYPALQQAGIASVVNGPFTFCPDGNPNIGPVQGKPGYWDANGVMAGFAQAGGVGLVLSNWIVKREAEGDFFAMDSSRFGAFAGRQYVFGKAQENYSRRFKITYPNEELPVGRGLKTTPIYSELRSNRHAVFGANFGQEYALFFADSPDKAYETPGFRRCPNTFSHVAAECLAARTSVGILETNTFSKYEVTGAGSAAWLDNILACSLPKVGRAKLAPMLSASGRLRGDLTVLRLGAEEFLLMGSGLLQKYHQRHFAEHSPLGGSVCIRNVTEEQLGFSVFGPKSRELLQRLVSQGEDVTHQGFGFLQARRMEVGHVPSLVTRISVTGELGYEISVPAAYHWRLFQSLEAAGSDLGLRLVGARALNSLRLEKAFGAWGREFSEDYTPSESGLDRFVSGGKSSDFVGKQAFAESSQSPPKRQLKALKLQPLSGSDVADADPSGWEPIWVGGRCAGFVTSGAYGHCVGESLALGYLETAILPEVEAGSAVEISVLGHRVRAEMLPGSIVDPQGKRMRDATVGTVPFQ